MKVRNRPVKCDMLLLDEDTCRLSVMTHRQKIQVTLTEDGKIIGEQDYSFAEFAVKLLGVETIFKGDKFPLANPQ